MYCLRTCSVCLRECMYACEATNTWVQVMEVFQEMVFKGCERSVITYSSLISACEKAGQSDLALELFAEMAQEGCVPNTVTYNSLITACAQGETPPAPPHPHTSLQVYMCCSCPVVAGTLEAGRR